MNIKSKCCTADIVESFRMDYPDGTLYGISKKVQMCEECGNDEPIPVECCDNCGEPADHRGLKNIDGDDLCFTCRNERLNEIMEEIQERTGLGK